MPTSEHWQIPFVCEVIARQKPAGVLDVGAGYGKYGVLAREYSGATVVDAIDVAPPRYPVYNRVFVGDLRHIETILPADAGPYDLALFIDVIEHLEKGEAYALLDALTRRARRVLITTPLGFRKQEIPGLPYETHRSGWYPWDFAQRYVLHTWQVFPGHFTRHLHLPRLWQLLAVVSRKAA